MRVDVPRSRVGGTVFDGQSGLKLVSHCRDRDDDQQDVLKEYLVYRTFNLLTEESSRVRLARVTYVDGEDNDDPVVRYAFFIEEAEAMAERLGALYLEVQQASPRNFGAKRPRAYPSSNTWSAIPTGRWCSFTTPRSCRIRTVFQFRPLTTSTGRASCRRATLGPMNA
jgi:hypothetical protein